MNNIESNRNLININNIAKKIIDQTLMNNNIILGQPNITMNTNNVQVTIPYYPLEVINIWDANTIHFISELLSNIYKIPVTLQIIRHQHWHLDATILSKSIDQQLQNNNSFMNIIKQLFQSIKIISGSIYYVPFYIIGIRVQINGQLHKNITRTVKQTVSIGTLIPNIIQTASHTNINQYGTYTIKVWINQKNVNESSFTPPNTQLNT